MRLRIASLTMVSPTLGSVIESSATGTSNGVFYGVIGGVTRPFREPGIDVRQPLPAARLAACPDSTATLGVSASIAMGSQAPRH